MIEGKSLLSPTKGEEGRRGGKGREDYIKGGVDSSYNNVYIIVLVDIMYNV